MHCLTPVSEQSSGVDGLGRARRIGREEVSILAFHHYRRHHTHIHTSFASFVLCTASFQEMDSIEMAEDADRSLDRHDTHSESARPEGAARTSQKVRQVLRSGAAHSVLGPALITTRGDRRSFSCTAQTGRDITEGGLNIPGADQVDYFRCVLHSCMPISL